MKNEQTGDKVSVSVADMQQWLEALRFAEVYLRKHEAAHKQCSSAIASIRAEIAAPVQPLPSDHVCGLQGFDGMRDECPGCERNRAYRASAPTLGTAEGSE